MKESMRAKVPRDPGSHSAVLLPLSALVFFFLGVFMFSPPLTLVLTYSVP